MNRARLNSNSILGLSLSRPKTFVWRSQDWKQQDPAVGITEREPAQDHEMEISVKGRCCKAVTLTDHADGSLVNLPG